jgi:hypothetical protein
VSRRHAEHAVTELAESQASDPIIMEIAGKVSLRKLAHHSHVRMETELASSLTLIWRLMGVLTLYSRAVLVAFSSPRLRDTLTQNDDHSSEDIIAVVQEGLAELAPRQPEGAASMAHILTSLVRLNHNKAP